MKLSQQSIQSFIIPQILKDHWHNVLSLGLPITPVILKEIQKVIKCRDVSMGYALYFCEHCNSFKHVPFTCKSRFCNSCGMVYVKKQALKLSSKLIKRKKECHETSYLVLRHSPIFMINYL